MWKNKKEELKQTKKFLVYFKFYGCDKKIYSHSIVAGGFDEIS
jgi:hypothetical protein